VLVDEAYTIKVADFGLSQPLQSREHREHATGRCGYIRCIPPEVFKNREFSLSSDVWAYGMLLYELLTLTQPYDGASYSDIRRFVKKNVRYVASGRY
jgi:serine/threonine protein kinase